MDSFEQKLKEDAGDIRVAVSPELDDRIRASLESVSPVAPERDHRTRPAWFWWASSLTGAAAAAVVLAVINLGGEEIVEAPPAVVNVPAIAVPKLDVRPAMALEVELENLRGDLERAEKLMRGDLDRIDRIPRETEPE